MYTVLVRNCLNHDQGTQIISICWEFFVHPCYVMIRLFEFYTLETGSVIKGWDAGVATMIKGEKSLLTCKPEYGYGDKGSPPKIPGNATLQFEIELLSWQGDDILRNGGVMMSTLKKGSDKDYYRPREGAQVEGKYNNVQHFTVLICPVAMLYFSV